MESFFKNRWFVALIYALLGLAVLYMLQLIRPLIFGVFDFLKAVITPFFAAMVVAYVLHPIVCLLHERKVPRTVAVLLIYAVFLTSAAVVLLNLIPIFLKQVKELNEHIPDLTLRAQSLVDGLNDSKFLPESVRIGINKSLVKLENGVSTAVSNYLDGLGDKLNSLFVALIVPFLAFYILKDFRLLERAALALVPKPHRRQTVRMLADIDEALGNYVRGQFLVCLIVGVLAYIGYWIIGMPYALLLASLVALFNIIPYIGPFLGAAPALIMASTVSLKMVLLVVVVNLSVQILEGNVVSPQVVGKKLRMHPLTIIFVLLVGGKLAGIVGMIGAVPFYAVGKVLFHHLRQYYIARRTP
jgi:predicted PurR-regulated permease PerM